MSNVRDIKTRGFTYQNGNGLFPHVNSVFHFDQQGQQGSVTPSRNLVVSSLTMTVSSHFAIPSSGSIRAPSLSTNTTFLSSGHMDICGANVTITGDQETTGFVVCSAIHLTDLSGGNGNGNGTDPILTATDVSGLVLVSPNNPDPSMITQDISKLAIDPHTTAIQIPKNPGDHQRVFDALTSLLEIFNSRGIFIQLAR